MIPEERYPANGLGTDDWATFCDRVATTDPILGLWLRLTADNWIGAAVSPVAWPHIAANERKVLNQREIQTESQARQLARTMVGPQEDDQSVEARIDELEFEMHTLRNRITPVVVLGEEMWNAIQGLLAHDEALSRPCTICGAKKGRVCRDLSNAPTQDHHQR